MATDDVQTAANAVQPQTNGQNAQAPPQNAAAAEPRDASRSPEGAATVQFDRGEYKARGSVLVTVQRQGATAGDARVDFTAASAAAGADGYLDRRPVVFVNGEDTQSFTVNLTPNFTGAPSKINLALTNPENAELGDPHQAVVLLEPFAGRRDYFLSLISSVTSNPNVGRVFRHVLLGFVLIGSIFLTDYVVGRYADSHEQQWDVYLNPKAKPELTFYPDSQLTFKDYEQDRLRDQLARIRDKEAFHRELMEFYYKGYYMGIIIFSFTAALAAITLVLISKGGWSATSEYIITTFFVMTCASLFYGSWAGLFKQEENITTNKVLYLKYDALENELFSYATTGEALNYNFTTLVEVKPAPTPTPEGAAAQADSKAKGVKGGAASTAEQAKQPEPQAAPAKIGIKIGATDFIHYVDLQLAQDNIAIGFDYSQIPNYKNAFSSVGTTK